MKKKILLFFAGCIGIMVLFFVCGYASIFLDSFLKDPKHIKYVTRPDEIIRILQQDPVVLQFTFSFFVLLLLGGFILFFSETNTYKSEQMKVTKNIKTPVPAGQGQFGTQRWLTKEEIEEEFHSETLSKKEILNYEGGEPLYPDGGLVVGKIDMKNGVEKILHIIDDLHAIILGATRAGKTRNHVLQTICDLMLAGENIFAIDMKQELYDYTAPKAKKLGYLPICIDFIHPYQSDRYDYLGPIVKALKEDDVSKAIYETWNLVSQLVGEPPENGEKLWNSGESSTLAACIMAVAYDNMDHPEYQNLTNVFFFITEMCTEYRGAMPLVFYIQSLPETHPSRILLAATNIAAFKTRASFYVSAVMTLRLLTMPSINNMTSKSDFDLEELLMNGQKVIIYLCLPARDKTYFPLAALTLRQISDQIDAVADKMGGRLDRRFNFIDDEIGNMPKITNLPNQLAFLTGKGIRHNLFIQSYAQLDYVYGKEVAQIIKDNCDLTIYLRSPNQDTRKEISNDLGDYTVSTYSLNNNQPVGSLKMSGNRGESTNLTGRKLLFPEEVKQIKRPNSLVMSDTYPAITYAPDLSKWTFNQFLGLGSKRHNQKLRLKSQKERKKIERPHNERMALWGIWTYWKEQIDLMIEQQEQAKAAKQAAKK
ncbi:type IV secretory system conjugative DNA transfer family protein [Anaerostipes caccae]